MANSNARPKSGKATKPRDGFPLWVHQGSGRWCRKVLGKHEYFGLVADDPKGQAALEEWLRVKDDLLAGRGRRPKGDASDPAAFTLRDLVNAWLRAKKALLESGELAERTFKGYKASGGFLLATLGKGRTVASLTPADFQKLRGRMAKGWGPVRLKNEMNVVASMFGWGEKAKHFPADVDRFGPGWIRPSAKTLRKNRAAKGPRLFTPEELKALLASATTNMKAMLLCGVQAGFGNTDLAMLPIAAIDLENGWLDYPRVKTAIGRRIPLWPETIEAIRQALAERHEPKDKGDASLAFIGRRGESYTGQQRVTQEFDRVARWARVSGRTFYDLRRTFQTIGEEAGDLTAVQSIMGHAPASGDMSAVYRQRVSDDRLQAVVNHVRNWLFGDDVAGGDEHHEGAAKPDVKARAVEKAELPRRTLKLFVG